MQTVSVWTKTTAYIVLLSHDTWRGFELSTVLYGIKYIPGIHWQTPDTSKSYRYFSRRCFYCHSVPRPPPQSTLSKTPHTYRCSHYPATPTRHPAPLPSAALAPVYQKVQVCMHKNGKQRRVVRVYLTQRACARIIGTRRSYASL